MNKWIYTIFMSLALVLLFAVTSGKISPVLQANATTQTDGCDYSCPVIHFTWNTQEEDVAGHYIYADKEQVVNVAGHYTCPGGQHLGTGGNSTKCYQNGNNSFKGNAKWVDTTYTYVCPSGYSSNPGNDNCRKFIDTTYKTVTHSADVAYNKSEDPTKCHRPSDSQLEDMYGMDHDAVDAFKDAHPEWLDSTKVVPEGKYLNDAGMCVDKADVCTDPTATNYDANFNNATEVVDNTVCVYPEATITPTITPTITVTPTDTETPTATPTEALTPTVAPTTTNNNGGGDGLSDGKSSCPECTEAPHTQGVLGASTQAVLGASTMAETGTFTQNLMNIITILGMISLVAGATKYAKENK